MAKARAQARRAGEPYVCQHLCQAALRPVHPWHPRQRDVPRCWLHLPVVIKVLRANKTVSAAAAQLYQNGWCVVHGASQYQRGISVLRHLVLRLDRPPHTKIGIPRRRQHHRPLTNLPRHAVEHRAVTSSTGPSIGRRIVRRDLVPGHSLRDSALPLTLNMDATTGTQCCPLSLCQERAPALTAQLPRLTPSTHTTRCATSASTAPSGYQRPQFSPGRAPVYGALQRSAGEKSADLITPPSPPRPRPSNPVSPRFPALNLPSARSERRLHSPPPPPQGP